MLQTCTSTQQTKHWKKSSDIGAWKSKLLSVALLSSTMLAEAAYSRQALVGNPLAKCPYHRHLPADISLGWGDPGNSSLLSASYRHSMQIQPPAALAAPISVWASPLHVTAPASEASSGLWEEGSQGLPCPPPSLEDSSGTSCGKYSFTALSPRNCTSCRRSVGPHYAGCCTASHKVRSLLLYAHFHCAVTDQRSGSTCSLHFFGGTR